MNDHRFFKPETVVERDIPYIPTILNVRDLRINHKGELTLLTDEQEYLFAESPELQENKRYSKTEISNAAKALAEKIKKENPNAQTATLLEPFPYSVIRYKSVPGVVYKSVLGEGNFGAVKLVLGEGALYAIKLQTNDLDKTLVEYSHLNNFGKANKKNSR